MISIEAQETIASIIEAPTEEKTLPGIETFFIEDAKEINVIEIPLPELSKKARETIASAEAKWLSEHPNAYNGPMFFPVEILHEQDHGIFEIHGHFYFNGYALHSLLRDRTPEGEIIRDILAQEDVHYDAGLAVSVLVETEKGPVVIKSGTTAYAQHLQWQMPGGNFQHEDALITAIEELHEEMGIPRNVSSAGLKPFTFYWRKNEPGTENIKGNPTLVYSLNMSKTEVEKYLASMEVTSEDKDHATEIKFVDIKKLNGEFTSGAATILKLYSKMRA